MHGNVWEWCADAQRVYDDRAQIDPGEPESGQDKKFDRALRGGSWGGGAGWARSAYRDVDHRGGGWSDVGFRFALRSRAQDPGRGGDLTAAKRSAGRDGPGLTGRQATERGARGDFENGDSDSIESADNHQKSRSENDGDDL
jgi:hypothetical protein